MEFIQKIGNDFYKNIIADQRYLFFWNGLKATIAMALIATFIGVSIGILIALIKNSAKANKRLRWAEIICNLYVNLIRGTPVVLQLMIIYYIVFRSSNISSIVVGGLAFGINSGAYVSEIVRGGIESIDKGQMEAGRSLGLNRTQTMRLIILPQAIKNILPSLGNEFVMLIKETSVAGYIGIRDVTKASDIVASRTYNYFFPLMFAACIYLVLTLGLSKLISILERRLAQSDNR
ncbi:amino acid ABC transporter membrane protein (PAAT family) [Hydrogenoanaerobacterium saccharovorans]|uniref:Amino acid ABC transporter membrane protein, PAAT family n=1 Tax=Hydrogenoanaerobacterium saccharovorans TaxID=474960 RepID=A0A1H8A4I8_9FIRM|nr:amino acid ABC transporter permease [Hydrogenoanaerobacterium saccharovorans]RPF48217.1 amino acid ABC transporter membrane protein (PAAT family) [Hydrogenoanaerobacterium saccharovorans]SEM64709.1 amino acid ABC transporter membrane protein, PAAT family [Hydrogenoanaerobacterium saccharovorans]